MSANSARSLSIIPLDSRVHSFIRFCIIPVCIVGDLFLMISDYADYNYTMLYTAEILCFALSIAMFAFTEVGFLQQARYACYTIIVGFVALTASNVLVAVMAWNKVPQILSENFAEIVIRIAAAVAGTMILTVYYTRNLNGFYPSEKGINIDESDDSAVWDDESMPHELKVRESWVRNRLKSSVVEANEEPEILQ